MNQDSDYSELSEIPIPQLHHRSLMNPESISGSYKHQNLQIRSPSESINPESFSFNPEINQREQNSSYQSESYLNISFQEIISLIFNNQCPQLVSILKYVFNRTLVLVNILAIFTFTQIVTQVWALYLSIISNDLLKPFFLFYYCFKFFADFLLLYICYQIRYNTIETEQLHQGDINHTLIEFLKHTIKINSPLDEYLSFDGIQSQAQQVANIIASKISTLKWLQFLIDHNNAHIYALSRITTLCSILVYVWGNLSLINWFTTYSGLDEQYQEQWLQITLTFFSLFYCYLILFGLFCVVILVSIGIPVLICLVIWQSCSWMQSLYHNLQTQYILHQRERFLNSLESKTYLEIKSQQIPQLQEECAICLQNYDYNDMCVMLPCNVDANQGKINHLFHDECIRIWIEECGSCPICRTRFVQRID